jgi:hypothetical protein
MQQPWHQPDGLLCIIKSAAGRQRVAKQSQSGLSGVGTYDVKALSLRNVGDVDEGAGALCLDAGDQAVHNRHHMRVVLPAG